MQDNAADNLPSYSNPPVVETVLGVHFGPIRGLSNALLGKFWDSLGADWPYAKDAPSLSPQSEQFGEGQLWGAIQARLTVSSDPSCRVLIHNRNEDHMIQVQKDQLHLNWLGHGASSYPRYGKIRPEFDMVFEAFRRFLQSQKLGDPTVTFWEVTYVNHFPKGTVWNEPTDWLQLFAGIPTMVGSGITSRLESFGGEWHFEIEPDQARLHVSIRHGAAKADKESDLLVATLTARGRVADGVCDLGGGLDLGRETIVRAFTELTSAEAHKLWRREE